MSIRACENCKYRDEFYDLEICGISGETITYHIINCPHQEENIKQYKSKG